LNSILKGIDSENIIKRLLKSELENKKSLRILENTIRNKDKKTETNKFLYKKYLIK